MKIRFKSIRIPSDLLPHQEHEEDQMRDVAYYIYEALQNIQPLELELDERLLVLTSFLSSKMVENVVENLYAYQHLNKGAKYLSGDVSISISEAITYLVLHTIYGIKLRNIIPFRTVKYLGVIADAVIDISKEPKIAQELNSSSGLLFINIRSSMSSRNYQIIERLRKSLINLEIMRYPDNYGLISLVTLDKEGVTDSFIFVSP